MDEREKLRKFRELDDAFAEALRGLDNPERRREIPTGPPVRPLEEQPGDDTSGDPEADFERRLKALMKDYALPAESVSDLVQTLRALGRIA